MKNYFNTLLLLVCAFTTMAQAPQKFNYQAVARNAQGAILTTQNVKIRASILDGSSNGASQYTETHSVTTSQLGLFNLAIGGGTVVSGNFTNITWANGDKFLKVEMDATGGNNFSLAGTSQLLSVPYALNAGNSYWKKENYTSGIPIPYSAYYLGEVTGGVDVSAKTGLTVSLPDGLGHAQFEFRQEDTTKILYADFTVGEGDYGTRLAQNLYDPNAFSIESPNGPSIVIDKNNKVGIGLLPWYVGYSNYEADKNVLLQINGDLITKGGVGNSSGRIVFENSNHQIFRDSMNNLILNTTTFFGAPSGQGNIVLLDGGTAANGINQNTGNVGINTANPKSKLQVSNGDVFIEKIGSGVIMKSPNGQCWRMTVTNSGQPVFTSMPCP